jgi:hypothetical protein
MGDASCRVVLRSVAGPSSYRTRVGLLADRWGCNHRLREAARVPGHDEVGRHSALSRKSTGLAPSGQARSRLPSAAAQEKLPPAERALIVG